MFGKKLERNLQKDSHSGAALVFTYIQLSLGLSSSLSVYSGGSEVEGFTQKNRRGREEKVHCSSYMAVEGRRVLRWTASARGLLFSSLGSRKAGFSRAGCHLLV